MTREEAERVLKAIKQFDEKAKEWSREQTIKYLVELGTHNPDGSLHENYGGTQVYVYPNSETCDHVPAGTAGMFTYCKKCNHVLRKESGTFGGWVKYEPSKEIT